MIVGDVDVVSTARSIFSAQRLDELLRLAARAPDEAAAAAELAIIKSGDFAVGSAPPSAHARVAVWNMERGRTLDQWLAIPALREVKRAAYRRPSSMRRRLRSTELLSVQVTCVEA